MNSGYKVKLFFYKILHWEYWPIWIIYLPCFIMYPYYALKCRSSLFFTVANVGIENSGAFLTSKYNIYCLLNPQLIPKTYLIDQDFVIIDCLTWMANNNIHYPVIVKPDYGLRGFGIKLLKNENELSEFVAQISQNYLIQEFVDFKNEIGVFLIRDEHEDLRISSIVKRQFVTITGDGLKTVRELILNKPRYAMQYKFLNEQKVDQLNRVLKNGEVFDFDRIGNHSKGTIFRDGNHLLSAQLTDVMNGAVSSLKFNYGRIDIKYKSLDDLLAGKDFKVIELNGVFSEPAHIYEPGYSLFKAWKVLLIHFKSLYQISLKSIKMGNKPDSFQIGFSKIIKHFKLTNSMK